MYECQRVLSKCKKICSHELIVQFFVNENSLTMKKVVYKLFAFSKQLFSVVDPNFLRDNVYFRISSFLSHKNVFILIFILNFSYHVASYFFVHSRFRKLITTDLVNFVCNKMFPSLSMILLNLIFFWISTKFVYLMAFILIFSFFYIFRSTIVRYNRAQLHRIK